jgi:hypothetical protein
VALPQIIRASNQRITRQSYNARAPIPIAARPSNIIKRNAEGQLQTQPNGLTDLCNDRSLMVAIGAIGMPTDHANFEIVTPKVWSAN